ncbi:hypothetical protein PBV87_17190 [Niameybacter massiliensis]|uniref:Uncharacterized protein n=1 Tax=Holtiella tumoricola TaxID=3018743 RepID=A0AA42DQ60_9FIRM|nr:hypothetical protein [Holtiella tumoricola]MDA3733215.1 hypothetical protein [Holtiella tumoricola]
MECSSKANKLKYAIITILLLPFILFPIKNILLGVYRWHIQQPESWQGLIEVCIIIGLLTIILKFIQRKYKVVLFWITIAIYLMLNGVIIPVIITYLYLEGVKHIGHITKDKLKINAPLNNHILDFIIGIITVSLCMIIMSLLGIGTISDLAVLVLVLTGIALVINHNIQLIIIDINNYIKDEKELIINILFSFIVGLILVQFAKSNRGIDYDSIWYGLRPSHVLFGDNSFYDNLGLVSFVYYYPKLMELFYAPISGFSDYSFIYSFNIFVLGMLILLTYSFMRSLGMEKKITLIALASIFSIPAIIGMGPTAKTDIFTCFLILSAHNLLYEYLKNKDLRTMILAIGIAGLSYGGKPTSLLYTTILVFTFIIIVLVMYMKKKIILNKVNVNKGLVILFTMIVLVVLGVIYRTYLLTGYPTYKTGANIWEIIGFSGNYPFYGSDEMGLIGVKTITLAQIFDRIYQALFNPKDLGHVIMTWIGNGYVFYLIILVLFRKNFNVDSTVKRILALNSMLFVSGLYYLITMPIPDGNYFIIQLVNLIIIIFYIFNSANVKGIKYIIKGSAFLFILLQFGIMFVSHWSWQWGTRKFDFNLFKNNFESIQMNESLFTSKGINEINEYLKDKNIRVVANGDENILHRLDSRVEVLNNLASGHIGNPNVLNTYEDFITFIEWGDITGFIIDKEDTKYPQYVEYVRHIQEEYQTTEIDDINYTLVVITQ